MLTNVLRPHAEVRDEPLTIAVYVPFRSELDIFPLIQWGMGGTGHMIFAPKVIPNSKEIVLYRIFCTDDLEEGAWGIREPVSDGPGWNGRADIVIVPGLAFDRCGMRTGYGKGYYDRLHERWVTRAPQPTRGYRSASTAVCLFAPALDFQLIDSVPSEAHDRAVDVVMTEKHFIDLR